MPQYLTVPRGIRVNGAAIAAIRERSGYSGTEFAELIGIHRAYLSNVEAGHRKSVSPAVAKRIADGLKVPMPAILAESDAA